MNSCCNNGAALLGLLLVSACTDTGSPAKQSPDLCQADTTPISTIQGDDYYSPLEHSTATTRGTVTHVISGAGVYIENSRALFIADESLSHSARPGQVLAVSGKVAELGSSRDKLTSLVEISEMEVCSESVSLPQTSIKFPMSSRDREALEGMRVSVGQALTVTDVYNFSKGELTLSANGVLRVPTEIARPGRDASRLDAENRSHSLKAGLGDPVSPPVSIGNTFENLAGVMGHDGRGQQLWVETGLAEQAVSTGRLSPAADGHIRIVSANLLNFFNGDGKGGSFPTDRGAKTHDEFIAQSQRLEAAMARIQPDLLAVQELENDGFGPESAAHSLLAILNNTGNGDWAFVKPATSRIGDDAITVGLFYRQQVLEAAGAAHVLGAGAFQGLSRQPLAQLFRDRRSGVEFLVAANHLKSKGSCPDSGVNSDQDDGQGCWNAARVSAVKAELGWLNNLAERAGTGNILVLGDMNAYRKEDPVIEFSNASWVDLVERVSGLPQYSFVYWGQSGTLDYLFASPALARLARAAQIWHVNAGLARNMDHPKPWLRFSDHDPVIVDFDFSQLSTSN